MSNASRVNLQRSAHVSNHESNKNNCASRQRASEANSGNKTSQAFFQAKLSIGQPGDSYERQADSMADAVVHHKTGNTVQRMCPGCEKEKLQKKSEGGGTASPALTSQIESSSGRGKSLPNKTLTEMNSSFGVDFGNVNIHTDAEAVSMNRELGALAFTHGNDIYFNSGMYDTDSSGGRQLLAHELTHVIQQGAVGGIQRSMAPNIQANCAGKSYKNCGGTCTHASGYPGTCKWSGSIANGCVCYENHRSSRSLEEVLPYWIMALLSAAAIALLVACFASGVCEAGIIIGAAGAAVGAIIIGIFRASGIIVNEGEGETA